MNFQIFLFFVIVASALSADLSRPVLSDVKTLDTKSPSKLDQPIRRDIHVFISDVPDADEVPESFAKHIVLAPADSLLDENYYISDRSLYYKADPTLVKYEAQYLPIEVDSLPRYVDYPEHYDETYQIGIYDPQPPIIISDTPSIARGYRLVSPFNTYYLRRIPRKIGDTPVPKKRFFFLPHN